MKRVKSASMRLVGIWRRPSTMLAAIGGAVAAVFALLTVSPIDDLLATKVELPLSFALRAGLAPAPIDSRIKIFAFDDRTVAGLKSMDLSLSDWATLLESLDRRHPQGIYIDKLFDKPYPDDEIEDFVKRVKALKAKITVVAFVAGAIDGRQDLPLDQPRYHLSSLLKSGNTPSWLKEQSGRLFGANRRMAGAFSGIGHAIYWGQGFVELIKRIGPDQIVPHWCLFAATELTLRDGRFFADDREVPIDGRGRTFVNFSPQSLLSPRTFSLLPAVRRALAGDQTPIVEAGDYVVVLPAMYTGNTDWKETPFGSMPGGYVMVGLLNSLIRGDWLRVPSHAVILVLLASLIGAMLGSHLSSRRFWQTLFGATVAVVVLGLTGFVVFGLILPWLLAAGGLSVTAVAVFAERSRMAQLVHVRMAAELRTAQLVQDSFLPRSSIETPLISIQGSYESASECGGDWWGYFQTDPNTFFVMIGDVLGHGVSAALVTAAAFSTCVSRLGEQDPIAAPVIEPADILKAINDVLCRTNSANACMTFFLARIDLRNGQMVYAHAAQTFPVLIRCDVPATPGALPGHNRPVSPVRCVPQNMLGHAANTQYFNQKIQLEAGDKIVLFTDGLIENCSEDGSPWGTRNFRKCLTSHMTDTAAALRDAIVRDSSQHFGRAARSDDTTLVVIQYRPAGTLGAS